MIAPERMMNYRRICRAAFSPQASWLALILPVCSFALLPFYLPASQAQDLSKNVAAKSKVISGQVRINKRSDGESGVQLLETIINRVMNIPQVALTKSNTQIAQALKQENSPTNYKLAIRPKEAGKTFAPAPKVPLVIAQAAPSARFQNLAAPQSEASNNEGDDYAGATESWKGNALSRVAARTDSTNSADKLGLWENKTIAMNAASTPQYALPSQMSAPRAMPAASPNSMAASGYSNQLPTANMGKFVHQPTRDEEARRQNVPDLATSINKLYKVSKGLEDIQNISDRGSQIASADKAKWYSAPRQIQVVDDRPMLKDFREASAAGQVNVAYEAKSSGGGGGGGGAGAAYGGSMAADADSLDAISSKKSAQLQGAQQSNAVMGSMLRRAKTAAAPSAKLAPAKERAIATLDSKMGLRDKIALLPPNVATGIPGLNLNLGSTELQAEQALAQVGGKLKQQKIRNWMVYSWTKREGDGADSLQLFFRHGLLDAIRIFDADLISGGFGVSPGDQLEVVKERFGEPAFLLPEPSAEPNRRLEVGGQNYIYPISQVGFQLARRNSETPPQVVSVLIFSVK